MTYTGTAGSYGEKSIDTTVQSGSDNLVTSDAVYDAIDSAIDGVTYEADSACNGTVPCALVDFEDTKMWKPMAI